ncbi:DUF3263 domain-containing protein [Rhodococcus chondri]|uniref:DUF3263 domain-containing protein n=1 Tax=Rhodococcus chondri TaxID=3065941 RepID=A0ABU7JKV1_9NOCA|nr:DUF3263 domain-containing protein [Rhodococcus sp. CC-R104]MEE2030668.1 DUF3263 domain-containing protein [Rhodococcus sp. CC-R104]
MTDEAAMLAFALKWRHWNGGPDEDIFVAFGITSQEYFHRLRVLLTKHRWNQLEPKTLEQLVRICDERIHTAEVRTIGHRDRSRHVSSEHPLSRLSA